MGRGPVLQGLEEEPELLPLLLLADAEKPEDPGLEPGVVDADGPPAHLHPVEDEVVGQGPHPPRVLFQEGQVLGVGAREGVVHVGPGLLLLVPLQKGKVHHPEEAEALPLEAQKVRRPKPHRPQGRGRHLAGPRHEEEGVPGPGLRGLEQSFPHGF